MANIIETTAYGFKLLFRRLRRGPASHDDQEADGKDESNAGLNFVCYKEHKTEEQSAKKYLKKKEDE